MFKKILFSLGIATTLIACQNQSAPVINEEIEQEELNVIEGRVVEINQEDNISTITIDTENGIVILTMDDSAILVDVQGKYPIFPSDLETGTQIKAYVSNAMTLSEPPRVNAQVILGNADAEEVDYVIAKEVKQNEDTITILGRNKEYSLPKENCQLSPYKTKNVVTFNDISSGKAILIWSQSSYIMIIE